MAIDIIAESGMNSGCSTVHASWVVTRLINRPYVYNRQGDDFFVFLNL
ncbi:conserved protein of unknown function [Paenibacillus alvei]|uniref:Uncharacterized protein n=1 Tax=Paenibacillus alvei TaxID=44250 RepID=A0A383RGS3_PAEAL|nr:conserved protein of unknown function [Paenibacillus alvei]